MQKLKIGEFSDTKSEMIYRVRCVGILSHRHHRQLMMLSSALAEKNNIGCVIRQGATIGNLKAEYTGVEVQHDGFIVNINNCMRPRKLHNPSFGSVVYRLKLPLAVLASSYIWRI